MPKRLTVIDLFAGVGGLSLGAARAGFDVCCAVELDSQAISSHALNFPRTRHVNADVSTVSGTRLLELAGVKPGELAGLIGGPPCQGFSNIGLRTAADPRNSLFVDFFRVVAETKPRFFLAENVPGVLDERNDAVRYRAMSLVPRRYRVLPPISVKASNYGAPTTRTRVFFLGYDADRADALSLDDFAPDNHEDVRVRHALALLPRIWSSWQSEAQGWRSVGVLEDSDFANRITDHVPAGVGDVRALARLKKRREVSGFLGTHHSAETVRRFRALRPGERDQVSKCMRLDADGYCPTLRAGTGPDRGSYQAIRPVHPNSPRVISPREGARLQGFPDWFQFHATKWHAFRQIGNSVSPIVAETLLARIKKAL